MSSTASYVFLHICIDNCWNFKLIPKNNNLVYQVTGMCSPNSLLMLHVPRSEGRLPCLTAWGVALVLQRIPVFHVLSNVFFLLLFPFSLSLGGHARKIFAY